MLTLSLVAIIAYRTCGAFLDARVLRRGFAGVRGRSIADPAPIQPMPEEAI